MYIVLGSSQINEKIKGSHSSFLFVDSFCAEENVVFSGGGVRSTPVQLYVSWLLLSYLVSFCSKQRQLCKHWHFWVKFGVRIDFLYMYHTWKRADKSADVQAGLCVFFLFLCFWNSGVSAGGPAAVGARRVLTAAGIWFDGWLLAPRNTALFTISIHYGFFDESDLL